jgi:predicted ATPase/DNA-binding NarL/FixJ family response regulator
MDAHTSHVEQQDDRAGTVVVLPTAAQPHNLPEQLTSFVGRERELAELGKELRSSRLVTLTGAGGCGKTRLALEAASNARDRFPDGAWWVDLAPLRDEQLVGAAIAEALGVRPLPGVTPLQAAGAYLASRRALVILDNCEHLLGACAEAAETLAQAAPDLVVLATSRAPLGVGGETDWRVPSLSLPTDGAESLARSDAARLFLERARRARPGFEASGENAESVAAICTELDGLPLAIELAAARLRILSVTQIADSLSERFRLLSGGLGTAPPRLQTMRASVEWSYELLSDQERALLRRLAVFAGGFNLTAVDAVCAGDRVGHEAVLDLLASLVDQSLVLAEERDSEVRYRLLETVRQYGLERLAESGEEGAARDRHRDHFLALAEQAAPHLDTARQPEWLRILDPEAANLAAAIEYALFSEPELALRLCVALHRWWFARGRFAEAELAHSRSLKACGDAEPGLRARVLRCRAWVAIGSGEFDAGESHATEALALAEEIGDQGTAARARLELGRAVMYADPRAGRPQLKRAAELARAAGDDWALVEIQHYISASHLIQSDHRQAARALDEVSALAERLGDPSQVAGRWFSVSWRAGLDGRFAEAREAAERSGAAVEAVGEPFFAALTDQCLGNIDVYEGEPARALERLERRLEQAVKLGVGFAVGQLSALIAFAELAADRSDEARRRLENLVPLIEGRASYIATWALCFLAEALRLQADADAEPTAHRAQASGEKLENRLLATMAGLTLGRLAAARGEWTAAREHALAHLDACVEGGHATYVPPCLDALAEVAAGLEANEDAVRLLAAAERARAVIGMVRVPPEEEHWAAIEAALREALGEGDYEAAHSQGAAMSTEDAVAWARRARGLRGRPPGGWDSLTPTEVRVAELVAEGLTNPQIAERMFVSAGTVKTHISHIFRKLGLHSRTELSTLVGERSKADG